MSKRIPPLVYILRCCDNSYYVGSTTDLMRRMNEHIMGTFNGYTTERLPIELVYSKSYNDMKNAMKIEKQLKGWTRKKKEALIKGELRLLHELAKCENETASSKLSRGKQD